MSAITMDELLIISTKDLERLDPKERETMIVGAFASISTIVREKLILDTVNSKNGKEEEAAFYKLVEQTLAFATLSLYFSTRGDFKEMVKLAEKKAAEANRSH